MQHIDHDNIIKLLEIVCHAESNCIGYAMPYMPMGSLDDGDIAFGKNYFFSYTR